MSAVVQLIIGICLSAGKDITELILDWKSLNNARRWFKLILGMLAIIGSGFAFWSERQDKTVQVDKLQDSVNELISQSRKSDSSLIDVQLKLDTISAKFSPLVELAVKRFGPSDTSEAIRQLIKLYSQLDEKVESRITKLALDLNRSSQVKVDSTKSYKTVLRLYPVPGGDIGHCLIEFDLPVDCISNECMISGGISYANTPIRDVASTRHFRFELGPINNSNWVEVWIFTLISFNLREVKFSYQELR